jgi:formate dehydrogenase iron-sulfur subunit
VMYVLQHADQPGLYSDLHKDPSISPLVSLWKGITKPLMSLGIGLAVFAGFFHFVTAGPKEVEEEEKAD